MARAGRKHECASTSNSKPITRKRETSMSSKTKRNESIGPKQPPPRRGGRKMLWRGTRRVRRKSNFAHTKSILNAANNRAANWTIGSKRNANSKAGRCRARRRARKQSETSAEKDRASFGSIGVLPLTALAKPPYI